MTTGETLYLALVLGAFAVFAATLSIVAWRTERYLHRQTKHDSGPGAQLMRHAA